MHGKDIQFCTIYNPSHCHEPCTLLLVSNLFQFYVNNFSSCTSSINSIIFSKHVSYETGLKWTCKYWEAQLGRQVTISTHLTLFPIFSLKYHEPLQFVSQLMKDLITVIIAFLVCGQHLQPVLLILTQIKYTNMIIINCKTFKTTLSMINKVVLLLCHWYYNLSTICFEKNTCHRFYPFWKFSHLARFAESRDLGSANSLK